MKQKGYIPMMKKISNSFAKWLIENGMPKEQEQVYSYGLECLLNEAVITIFLFLIALFLHKVPEMLVWDIAFTLLRVNLGGVHASTHAKCILSSTLIGVFSILLCPYLYNYFIVFIVAGLISCVIVFVIAPVKNKNHPISGAREAFARKYSIIIAVIEYALILLLYKHCPAFSSCIFLALFSVSLLGLWGTRNQTKSS